MTNVSTVDVHNQKLDLSAPVIYRPGVRDRRFMRKVVKNQMFPKEKKETKKKKHNIIKKAFRLIGFSTLAVLAGVGIKDKFKAKSEPKTKGTQHLWLNSLTAIVKGATQKPVVPRPLKKPNIVKVSS